MSDCPRCGKDAREEDRYCTRCGTAVVPESDSLSSGSISVSGEVTRRSQRSLVGAALVAVLVMVGYATWAGIGSDPPASPEAGPQTTLAAPDPDPDAGPNQSGVEPPFGRPVDLTLFVGGDEGVLAVDLRTGAEVVLPVSGRPVAASDGWLVAVGDSSSGLVSAAVQLDSSVVTDLDQFVLPVAPVAEAAEPGRAWLLSSSGGFGLSWVDLDLASGQIVESVPAPAEAWSQPFGPALVSSPAGGIFARRGGTYQRVHDGTLVVAVEDRALVRTCSGPTACELTWYASDDWTRLEVTVPTIAFWDYVSVSANGRLLGLLSADGLHLFDTERGEEYDLAEDVRWLTVSPDGAYVAAAVDAGVLLISIDDGQQVRLDLAGWGPAAGLDRDLLLAPAGDETEVGAP